MPALLFGSISTLADTSELQREAFNTAFTRHGLSWSWDQDTYRSMLGTNGGRDRVAAFADERGEQVDADAVHATKSKIFQETVGGAGIAPRPGVVETIAAAKDAGWHVALVTPTSPDNVAALLDALAGDIPTGTFDTTVDWDQVDERKPDPAAYLLALDRLGDQAGDCVAIEDNVGGQQSAVGAGIACVAFPNANTGALDFGTAPRLQQLDFAELSQLAHNA